MIEKYIKHLLFEHDCVVIPEFGGFIANYVGSDIHPIHHTFQPPSKNIAFNEMLRLNDGLLISHIATHENISREEAQKAVKEYTEFVKNEIRSKDKYKFEEIGTLYLNHEQRLQFEPENKINYLSHSFGLPELDYKPIERTSGYAKFKTKDRPAMMNPEASNEEDHLVFAIEKKNSRSRLLLAVVIPVLLLLAASAGYFLFLDNGNTALSSFDPFIALKSNRVEEDTATVVDDSFLFTDTTLQASAQNGAGIASAQEEETAAGAIESEITPLPETAPLTAPLANVKEEATTASIEETTVTPLTEAAPEHAEGIAVASKPPRFYVIIGGFSVEKNAYKLKDHLYRKGNNQAKVILPKKEGKLLKVSYADFDTFGTAALKAEELKNEYGNAVWVLKY